jgi:hypothetical protein
MRKGWGWLNPPNSQPPSPARVPWSRTSEDAQRTLPTRSSAAPMHQSPNVRVGTIFRMPNNANHLRVETKRQPQNSCNLDPAVISPCRILPLIKRSLRKSVIFPKDERRGLACSIAGCDDGSSGRTRSLNLQAALILILKNGRRRSAMLCDAAFFAVTSRSLGGTLSSTCDGSRTTLGTATSSYLHRRRMECTNDRAIARNAFCMKRASISGVNSGPRPENECECPKSNSISSQP